MVNDWYTIGWANEFVLPATASSLSQFTVRVNLLNSAGVLGSSDLNISRDDTPPVFLSDALTVEPSKIGSW